MPGKREGPGLAGERPEAGMGQGEALAEAPGCRPFAAGDPGAGGDPAHGSCLSLCLALSQVPSAKMASWKGKC